MEEIEKEMKNLLCKTMPNESKEPLLDIITILFLETEEIPLEEIAERTGYSLASISNTMKILENMNLVERIKKPRSKKVYFIIEKDLAKINLIKLNYISNHIKEVIFQLPILIKKYNNELNLNQKKLNTKYKDKNKKRIEIIQRYNNQLIEFNNILESWKKDLEKMMIKWQNQ